MPFNRHLFLSSCLAFSVTGCGVLGEKTEKNTTFASQDANGCMDGAQDKIERFLKGTIKNDEWNGLFDCLEERTHYGLRYVRSEKKQKGSKFQSYTIPDITGLSENFFFKKEPVPDQLVPNGLLVKRVLFGGEENEFSSQDIELLLRFARAIQRSTIPLIPLNRNIQAQPTPEQYGEWLGMIFEQADILAAELRAIQKEFVPEGAVVPAKMWLGLGDALGQLAKADLVSYTEYKPMIEQIKILLTNSENGDLKPDDMPELLSHMLCLGAMAYVVSESESDSMSKNSLDANLVVVRPFWKRWLGRLATTHLGQIVWAKFDRLMGTLPMRLLDSEMREALRVSLPKFLVRLFPEQKLNLETLRLDLKKVEEISDMFFDFSYANKWIATLEDWAKTDGKPLKIAADWKVAFEEALKDDQLTEEDKKALKRGLEISQKYPNGHFGESGTQITFSPTTFFGETANHVQVFNVMDGVITFLYKTYLGPDKKSAKLADLELLFEDFFEAMVASKKAHPAVPPKILASKRFLEARIFPYSSNGSSDVDIVEATQYLALLTSGGKSSSYSWKKISENDCPFVGRDTIEENGVEYDCFNKNFYSKVDDYWAGFPNMLSEFKLSKPEEQQAWIKSLEATARYSGYSSELIGLYDVESLLAFPTFIESAFTRFDENQNGLLDRLEIRTKMTKQFQMVACEAAIASQDPPTDEKALQIAINSHLIFSYIAANLKIPLKPEEVGFWKNNEKKKKNEYSLDRKKLYKLMGLMTESAKNPETNLEKVARTKKNAEKFCVSDNLLDHD